MTGSIGTRTITRMARATLLAATLGVATIGAAPAQAHSASGVPYHLSGGGSCGVGTVRQYLPLDMRSTTAALELGYWQSQLWRYTSTGWQRYRTFTWNGYSWMSATISSTMIVPSGWNAWYKWWWTVSAPAWSPTYGSLPSGSYAIRNVFYWSSTGLYHREWGTFKETGTTVCTF